MGMNAPTKSGTDTQVERAGTRSADDASSGEAVGLERDWRDRVVADEALVASARAVFEGSAVNTGALAIEALALAGSMCGDSPALLATPVAEETGRAAPIRALAPSSLEALFGHLQDALVVVLLRRASVGTKGGESLANAQAALRASSARRATAAIAATLNAARAEQAAGVAGGSAGEELARMLRHDIKTPLQAASLNLELLALESAEKGLNGDELDVIQRSIDQAVAMLRRFDGSGD